MRSSVNNHPQMTGIVLVCEHVRQWRAVEHFNADTLYIDACFFVGTLRQDRDYQLNVTFDLLCIVILRSRRRRAG